MYESKIGLVKFCVFVKLHLCKYNVIFSVSKWRDIADRYLKSESARNHFWKVSTVILLKSNVQCVVSTFSVKLFL
ncbi:hypothetical protein RUM44_001828 [Polyplax serrata]|uniref:Uncharacterized protein n=1 Tax=Polyplax serrata TaxID=468196 RepID=A0ABR1AL56_POLSC